METVLDAVLVSPPYVALALAYGLTYGMMGLMDLSVSARFTAAAYGGWLASRSLGWYPAHDPLVLLAAVTAAILVAFVCWLLLAPLTRADPLAVLIGSLGLTYVLQAGFQLAFGPAPRVYTTYPVESGVAFFGVTGTPLQWTGVAYVLVATVTVALLLHSKRWGRRLQAVAADPDLAAAVFGLDRRRLARQVALVTAVILGPVAVVYAAGHGVSPTTGVDIGILAFVATIVAGRERPLAAAGVALALVILRSAAIRWTVWELAGAGLGITLALVYPSLWRIRPTVRLAVALLAGLVGYSAVEALVGLESLPRWVVPASFQDVVPYLLILASLLVRPAGLFAARAARMV